MKTLGQRIRELREEKDLSLRELARKIQVSAPFLSDVELGRRYPSEKILSRLSNELETSLEELRAHDTRPPVEDMKRLVRSDPKYGIAFRRVIDNEISSEDLLEFVEKKSKDKKP